MLKRIDRIISQTFTKQVLWTLLILFLLWAGLTLISGLLNVKHDSTHGWNVITLLMNFDFLEESSSAWFELIVVLVGWLMFTGLLIAIITNAYFSRIEQVKEGLTRYSFKNHFVIIGNNNMTLSLIHQIYKWADYRNNYIIIHTPQNAREVKARIHSLVPTSVEKKLFVFRGSRDSVEELRTLHLEHSKMVLIIGEAGESGVDSRNIECLKLISGLLSRYKKGGKKKHLPCYLYLENQTTFTLLQQYDLPEHVHSNIVLHTFNLHESWANRVLVGNDFKVGEVSMYYPLDYKPVTDKNGCYAHFVIVGFNRLGQALAIQAARIAHFGTKQNTRITVIDPAMTEKRNIFMSQYPGLEYISDIDFEFLEEKITFVETREKLVKWANDVKRIMTVAICFKDPDWSLTIGLNLPYDIYGQQVPVLIRQEALNGFAATIREESYNKREQRFEYVRFFGMLSDACDLDFERDERAKYFHNNFLLSSKKDKRYDPKKPNFQEWDKLPEQFKWSNRYVADIYPVKIRSLIYNSRQFNNPGISEQEYGRQMDAVFRKMKDDDRSKIKELGLSNEEVKILEADIELLAIIEHDRWIADRVLAGWNYGPEKDNDKRLSPYMIPYDELSEEIKMYDREPSVRMFDLLK